MGDLGASSLTISENEQGASAKQFTRKFVILEASMGFVAANAIFNTTYLKSIGLSAVQVGTFMSVNSLIGMLFPIFWGAMSDKYRTVKKVLFFCIVGVVFTYAGIPLYARIRVGLITLAPIMLMTNIVFQSPLDALLTSWIMQKQRVMQKIQYGRIRLFWSGAYSLACFAYSGLMSRYSISIVFIGTGIIGLFALFALNMQTDVSQGSGRLSLKEMQFKRLLQSPPLLFFVIFLVLVNVTTPGLNSFLPYLLAAVNGKASIVGTMVGVRSACAVPLMFLSGRLIARFGPKRLLMVSGSLYGIAQLLFVLCTSAAQAVGICVFMGIAFGLLIPCQVAYINQLAPKGLVSTTQTTVSVVMNLSSSVVNFLGGAIIQSIGVRTFYLFSMICCFAAVAFFLLTTVVYKARNKDSEAA